MEKNIRDAEDKAAVFTFLYPQQKVQKAATVLHTHGNDILT